MEKYEITLEVAQLYLSRPAAEQEKELKLSLIVANQVEKALTELGISWFRITLFDDSILPPYNFTVPEGTQYSEVRVTVGETIEIYRLMLEHGIKEAASEREFVLDAYQKLKDLSLPPGWRRTDNGKGKYFVDPYGRRFKIQGKAEIADQGAPSCQVIDAIFLHKKLEEAKISITVIHEDYMRQQEESATLFEIFYEGRKPNAISIFFNNGGNIVDIVGFSDEVRELVNKLKSLISEI